MKRALCLFLLSLCVIGCATTETVRNARGTGETQVYNYSYDKVFYAAKASLEDHDIQIIESDEQTGALIGTKDMNLLTTWGERVAIYLYKIDDSRTKVEIISRRVSELDVLTGAKNWTKTLFSSIEQRLGRYDSSQTK